MLLLPSSSSLLASISASFLAFWASIKSKNEIKLIETVNAKLPSASSLSASLSAFSLAFCALLKI